MYRLPGGCRITSSQRLLCSPAYQPSPPLHAGATNATLATAATTTAAALLTAAGVPVHNATIFTPTNDAFAGLGLEFPAADFYNATLNSTSFQVSPTLLGCPNSSAWPGSRW
jgi:hypothetical protein